MVLENQYEFSYIMFVVKVCKLFQSVHAFSKLLNTVFYSILFLRDSTRHAPTVSSLCNCGYKAFSSLLCFLISYNWSVISVLNPLDKSFANFPERIAKGSNEFSIFGANDRFHGLSLTWLKTEEFLWSLVVVHGLIITLAPWYFIGPMALDD